MEQKQDALSYLNPYPKKDEKELQAYSTLVIDGYSFKISPKGNTYCAGPVVILKKEGSAVSSNTTQAPRVSVTKALQNSHEGISIKEEVNKVILKQNKRGRPPKIQDFENQVIALAKEGHSYRSIVLGLNHQISIATVQRIIAGQRI